MYLLPDILSAFDMQVSEVVLSEGQLSDITPIMHLIVVLQSRSSQIDSNLWHLVLSFNHSVFSPFL